MHISPLVKQLARRTGVLFLIFLAAKIVPDVVDFPARYELRIDRAFDYVAALALFFQAAMWAGVLVNYWTRSYTERHGTTPGDSTTINAISVLVKIALWVIIAVAVINNVLGKDVTGLVAGLGVGGIAIAFALQNVLGDLFAAVSIVTDKPFVVGDAIQVDTFSGTVERIGLKSTRVRSDSGEQIIFGNGELVRGRIRNFGRMEERQSTLVTRVSGATTTDQLTRIPRIIREAIEQRPATRFVRCTLTAVGDSTIDFTTIYFMTNPSYQLYAETQQAVVLDVMHRFEREHIVLAVQLEGAVRLRTAGQAPVSSQPVVSPTPAAVPPSSPRA